MGRHGTTPTRDAGPRVGRVCARAWLCTLALGLVASCGTTVDPIGYNSGAGVPLRPLTPPAAAYPNPFRDRGHTDAEIATKISGAFMQLFHGVLATQPIYFPVPGSTDRAYIQDVFHNDVRTEGIGLGMLIAVELDHRDELDRLWTYAKSMLRVSSGSSTGYFNSFCEIGITTTPCLDPYGLQQMTMALILANDRYPRTDAAAMTVDYAADARELLTLMRHKVDLNGGVVDGVTDTFDHATNLVLDFPNTSAAGVGRPSIEMPGYYTLWAQATGDPFWTAAAEAARGYWRRTADPNPTTGLMPVRATFAGVPVAGSDVFQSEAFRAQIGMALDRIWVGDDGWSPGESDRLLGFFASQGPGYGMSFTLDGTTVLNPTHDPALVAANGISAAIATTAHTSFVDEVWSMPVPDSANRYFAGLLYLVALLVLGGQMHVL